MQEVEASVSIHSELKSQQREKRKSEVKSKTDPVSILGRQGFGSQATTAKPEVWAGKSLESEKTGWRWGESLQLHLISKASSRHIKSASATTSGRDMHLGGKRERREGHWDSSVKWQNCDQGPNQGFGVYTQAEAELITLNWQQGPRGSEGLFNANSNIQHLVGKTQNQEFTEMVISLLCSQLETVCSLGVLG